jgi:uncharacterized protein YbjT (DUF2867 family)
MSRTALVLGATGLVGNECLKQLLESPHWHQVTVISRRSLPLTHDKLRVEVMDLDDMAGHADLFRVDDVFCCLGSTLKKAGSKGAFYHVDHGLCVLAARLAAEAGVGTFLMVSAVNAARRSPFFYARTKGEAEQDVQAAGLDRVSFCQPSFLLGDRQEARPAERLGIQTMQLVRPVFHRTGSKLTPVHASVVAAAMLGEALDDRWRGVHRLRYRQMIDRAARR